MNNTKKHPIHSIILYLSLIIASLVILLPFMWMISSSLKMNTEVFTIPFKWIPTEFKWDNYRQIWTKIPLFKYFLNTIKVSVIVTALQVFTSSFAAYAFAKIDFTGKDKLFLAYIMTIAIPWQVYMVPQFIMMKKLGLTDTHLALILLQTFTAFGVFLIRQFYVSIPDDLCEAARIDGLSEYGIYARIMLPLTKPAIATLTIFSFVGIWNDFMGPLLYINTDSLRTIQLGLRGFITEFSADYALIMAASVLALIPVLILFLSMQKFFVEGVATSGLKA